MKILFLLLVSGLAHDDYKVRDQSEECLNFFNVCVDHRAELRELASTSRDAEVVHRVRRILARYQNVMPTSEVYFPRMDSMKGPPAWMGKEAFLAYQDHLHYAANPEFNGDVHLDRWYRWQTRMYVQRLLGMGMSYTQAQDYLDDGIHSEKAKGTVVLAKDFVWEDN